jgi:hypothetical protein
MRRSGADRAHRGRDGFGDHLLVTSPWGDPEAKGVLVLSHIDTVHEIGIIGRSCRSGSRAISPTGRGSMT